MMTSTQYTEMIAIVRKTQIPLWGLTVEGTIARLKAERQIVSDIERAKQEQERQDKMQKTGEWIAPF